MKRKELKSSGEGSPLCEQTGKSRGKWMITTNADVHLEVGIYLWSNQHFNKENAIYNMSPSTPPFQNVAGTEGED